MASGTESNSSLANTDFVKITGLVEDIFVGEDFQIIHNEYCSQHCDLFAGGKNADTSSELERKSVERFNAFRAYSIQMASFLETELKRSLGENFEIREFLQEVESRAQRAESLFAQEAAASSSNGGSAPNSPRRSGTGDPPPPESMEAELIGMDGEIFDMLLTFKDYARFQELMVDYAKMKEGQTPNMDGLVSLRRLDDDEADSA